MLFVALIGALAWKAVRKPNTLSFHHLVLAMSSFLSGSSLATTLVGVRGASVSDLELATTSLSSTNITIVPLVSIDRVRLLGGLYGPFRPPAPAVVPLWVAVYLKRRKKAILVPPPWLTAESLADTLKEESTSAGFASLPHYWLGVAQTVLAEAAGDVPNSTRVRALLKDIRQTRQSKILSGASMINSVHLQMTNISAHEIAELRPFFGTAFTHLKALRAPSDVEKETKVQNELDLQHSHPQTYSPELRQSSAFPYNPSDSQLDDNYDSQYQETPQRQHTEGRYSRPARYSVENDDDDNQTQY